MEDTLLKGDFLFVNKFLYGAQIPLIDVRLPEVRDPEPGDIIVFKYPHDPSKDYIKRCIAVEGQEVMVRNKVVYIDGVPQQEDYVKYTRGVIPGEGPDNWGPRTVPPGHLFMMGDNRDNSADSRSWGFLDKELIKGKALFIYWSWDPDNKFLGFLNTPRLARIGDLVR
jgi:signal peptidase I